MYIGVYTDITIYIYSILHSFIISIIIIIYSYVRTSRRLPLADIQHNPEQPRAT